MFGLMARENSAAAMPFTEEAGALLDSITFLVFGAVLLGPALEHVSWQIALYAVLSLSIVRMLPVAISLAGTRARRSDGGVHRLVWPTRACLDRVRGDRRGHASGSRRADPHGLLPDGGSIGPRPWALGGTAGKSLRRLVPNCDE